MQEKLLINLAKANAAKRKGYKHPSPMERWEEDKMSLRKSINAKCYYCCCFDKEEVKNCAATSCPLWPVRPYQEKS